MPLFAGEKEDVDGVGSLPSLNLEEARWVLKPLSGALEEEGSDRAACPSSPLGEGGEPAPKPSFSRVEEAWSSVGLGPAAPFGDEQMGPSTPVF